MRMRKKKNLEVRLSAFEDILLVPRTDDRDFRRAAENECYFDIRELFGREAPLVLEIGCGKGTFAVEIAKRNPDKNFLAVEKYANVLVSACERLRAEGIDNLKFVQCSAEYLPSFIRPHTVEMIYLNFSCPFPKKKYASHRLTAECFLKIYDRLLVSGGEVHQKTDNRHFFEFSIEQLSAHGCLIKNVSLDLHAEPVEDNIVTEYEKRFSDLGYPIYRLEASFNNE